MTSFQSGRPMAPTLRPTARPSRTTPGRYNEDMEQLIFRMHQMLIDELDADQISALPADERRKVVEQAAETLLRREMSGVGGITRDQIVSRVVDEVVGLGPIDALMRDPSISEVMVNRPDEVYFEREGILYLSDVRFRDDQHIQRVIERIIAPIGRRVDESSPMVDAHFPDGSRVNVVIPPVAPKSPTITIRKFRADKLQMNDLLNAMNTGHEGPMSTVHSNSPRDGLARIENMVLMAALDLPDRAIREQVASALHLIVQLARFTDGVRRVTHVTEVSGMEGQIITLQDLFRFKQTGVSPEGKIEGVMAPTGIRPTFAGQFESSGIKSLDGLFLARAR